jgi:hypothetical protein
MQHLAPLALAFATLLTLSGCGGTEPTKTPATSSPGQQASADSAPTPGGLSGEEFVSKAESLSGSTVTLERCSLLTTPGGDGTLPCRVLDKQGMDITDASGLPVDIFIEQADLTPEAKAVVADCGATCTVAISGKLDRASDGTGYLSMTGVSLKAAG